MHSEEFILVTSKRKNRKPHKVRDSGSVHRGPSANLDTAHSGEEFAASIHDIHTKVERARQRILEECGSTCLHQLIENFQTIYQKYQLIDGPKEIVCYALGRFSVPSDWGFSCRLQLVLLLKLTKYFTTPTYIFDPAFSELEKRYLESEYCGFHIIRENEMAKRVATKPTLFYMIHADKELYANLYRSNQEAGTLHNITMFGNCLTTAFPSLKHSISNPKEQRIDKISTELLTVDVFDGFQLQEFSFPLQDPNNLFHFALTADIYLHILTEPQPPKQEKDDEENT